MTHDLDIARLSHRAIQEEILTRLIDHEEGTRRLSNALVNAIDSFDKRITDQFIAFRQQLDTRATTEEQFMADVTQQFQQMSNDIQTAAKAASDRVLAQMQTNADDMDATEAAPILQQQQAILTFLNTIGTTTPATPPTTPPTDATPIV